MATKRTRRSGGKVEKVMHEFKHGTLRSGRGGAKVRSRKQAVAIALSEARSAGEAVSPPKRTGRASTSKRSRSRAAA